MVIDTLNALAHDGRAGVDPHPLPVGEFDDGFRAVQVPTGQALRQGHPFVQTVVATSGAMATMSCPPPDALVRIKTALGQRADRDPLKARKSLLQARVVQALLDAHGLQYLSTATA